MNIATMWSAIQKMIAPKAFKQIKELEDKIGVLETELLAKGNIFFKDSRWLGCTKTVYGTVINGKLVSFHEQNLNLIMHRIVR